ncbi:hypothetical protein K502DRAFT_326671, partial [Neoconidiobolus thromboides FSU 785]
MINKIVLASALFSLLISTVTCKSKHYATVCVHNDDCYIKNAADKYGSSHFQKFNITNEDKGHGLYFGSNNDYSVKFINCNAKETKVLIDNNDSWKVYRHRLDKGQKQEDISCTRLWLD